MPAFLSQTQPTRAVIYCRVSSDRTGEQLSVESQERFCRDFCTTHGIEVIRVFVDNDIGASTYSLKDRPDFQRMVEWLPEGTVNILVAWTANRTTRNMREYLDLRDLCAERGLLYSYNGKTFDMRRTDDRFATGLDALLAERGADEIHTNVMLAKESAALAGRPHGRLLWGTRRIYDTHRVYKGTETDPVIGRYAQYLFDARWFRRVPKYRLAKVMNRARVRTPQPPMLDLPKDMPRGEKRRLREAAWDDARWTFDMVDQILSNPGYAGYRVHQGEIIGDSDWPGIIPKARWHALQERDKPTSDTAVKPRDRRVKHLLTGTLTCSLCGGVTRSNKAKGRRRALTCKRCHGTTILMDVADDAVVDLLMRRFAMKDAQASFRPADDNDAREAAAVELALLRKKLKAIEQVAIGGDLDDVEFAQRARVELKPKIAAAKAASQPPPPLPDFVTMLAVPNPRPVWDRMPIETQRMVVRKLLRLVLKPNPQPGRWNTPVEQRLDITWRPLP